ncbi:DUF4179 domain-containing protein [Paenibacillus kandeliae]|uniref:DUF4179 domain-containing protein n=1 Tax=Paenibacillus kandeliae TaxID=3231269 RepID=UPI00345B2E39
MKTDKLDQLLRERGRDEAEQMPPEIEARLQHIYGQIGQRRTAQQIRDDLAMSSPSNTSVPQMKDHGAGYEDGSLSVLPAADDVMTAQPERKRKRHRWIWQSMTAAAVLVIGVGGVLGSGFFSADMARSLKQIPGTEYVYRFTSEMGWQTADEREENAKPTIQQNGVTMTLESLVYDGSKLRLEVSQQTEQKNAEIEKVEVIVNGKNATLPLDLNATAEQKQNIFHRQVIDQNHANYAMVYDLIPEVLQGKNDSSGRMDGYETNPKTVDMNIRITLKHMTNQPFIYHVNATRTSKLDRYAIPKRISTGQGIAFDKVEATSTPLATYVHVKLDGYPDWKQRNHNQYILYMLTDSEGNVYRENPQSTGSPDDKHSEYDALPTEATGLTLIPWYFSETSDQQIHSISMKNKPSAERPIQLDMGSTGSISITNIQENDDQIILHVIPGEPYQLYQVVYSLWYEQPNSKREQNGVYATTVNPDLAVNGQYIITYDKAKLKGTKTELYYTIDKMNYLPQIPIPSNSK